MPLELLSTEYAGAVTASTVALVVAACRRELRAVLGANPPEEAVAEMARHRLIEQIAGRAGRSKPPGR